MNQSRHLIICLNVKVTDTEPGESPHGTQFKLLLLKQFLGGTIDGMDKHSDRSEPVQMLWTKELKKKKMNTLEYWWLTQGWGEE